MTLTAQNIGTMMAARGLRSSVQRVAVMRYLVDHRTHPSADEIYNGLRAEMPSLALATDYNALDALVGAGLVRRLDFGMDVARFDYAEHEHAHFVCRKCGRVYDIECVMPRPSVPADFEAADTDVTVYGLCKKCKNK